MMKTMTLRAGLLALGLTLSACAEYTPATANCFDEQGAKTTPRLSTKGSVVAPDDTGCSFTALGAAD
jgi:hypothetical protein